MNVNFEKLYSELRQMRQELAFRLNQKDVNKLIRPLMEEELKDIDHALMKLRNNDFGVCEISGELLPEDLLRVVPTLRRKDDVEVINSYFCKPIYR